MTHTHCENCLHDFKDNEWVYCDKCWQKFEEDIKKLRIKLFQCETKQSGPKVDERFICRWAERIWADSNLGIMQVQYLLKAMLNEAGVEIEEEK